MGISNKGSRKVRPIHPGEMLREDFLPDYGLTVPGLPRLLGCRAKLWMKCSGNDGL